MTRSIIDSPRTSARLDLIRAIDSSGDIVAAIFAMFAERELVFVDSWYNFGWRGK